MLSWQAPTPTVEQADTQALQVALAANQFTGKGMTIAVLDTGLDTAHPAFANAPADAKFTKDYVSGILQAADLNAEALMPGVTADDVYLSAKIPFAFDYAGKDAQVAPGNKWDAENLEHGTHVAGISAGYAVDGEGAVTGVSCTVLLDGYDYDYSAAYASQPLPAPDGTLPTDT